MLFLGMANAYVMRTNMSVAIVAMVNQTAIRILGDSHDDAGVDTECGAVDGNVVITPGSRITLIFSVVLTLENNIIITVVIMS